MAHEPIDEAIEAFGRGEIIVVVDDDDRENEGDLIMSAAHATTEKVAFMIRYTSGILCAPLSQDRAEALRLDPMVSANDAPLGTAFTVSVDYRVGLTTGISAEERCNTVRAIANNNAGAGDFVRPGHVFPLIARKGGVLMRSGHTEAAVDLAHLSGTEPVGLLSELVNDDGTVKRGEEVCEFAKEHGLLIISVADIIAHRQRREQLVERIAEIDVNTVIGTARGIIYSTPFDDLHHLALVFGSIGNGLDILTRIHREDIIADVFNGARGLNDAFDRIKSEGHGVLIYLREGAAGVPAIRHTPDESESESVDGDDALVDSFSFENTQSDAARLDEWRDIGLGAQILRDLEVSSIRLLASGSHHYVALSGFGIKITKSNILDS